MYQAPHQTSHKIWELQVGAGAKSDTSFGSGTIGNIFSAGVRPFLPQPCEGLVAANPDIVTSAAANRYMYAKAML